MSYLSYVKPLLTRLRQPVWLSTLAALGVHGILWAILPGLPEPSRSEEAKAQRTVQLVELSPQELSKVPQFDLPSTIAPSKLPLGNLLPPPPLSQNFTFPSLDSYPIPNIPYPPPDFSTSSRTRTSTRSSWAESQQNQTRSSNRSQGNQNTSTQPTQPSNETGKQPSDQTDPPEDSTNPGDTPPADPPQDQARTLPDTVPKDAIAAQEALRRKFIFDGSGRTPESYNGKMGALATLGAETAKNAPLEKDWKTLDLITGAYPPIACPAKLGSDARVGVIVTPEGELGSTPIIVWSSGYPILDEFALSYVANYKSNNLKLPSSGKFQPTLVPFKFEPTEALCPPVPSPQPAS